MPATEQTWRDQRLLHKVFAVSSVAMLVTTVWVITADFNRGWKRTQVQALRIDSTSSQWRETQFQADKVVREKSSKDEAYLDAQSAPIDAEAIEQFENELASHVDRMRSIEIEEKPVKLGLTDRLRELATQVAKVEEIRSKRDKDDVSTADQELKSARTTAFNSRKAIIDRLNAVVTDFKQAEERSSMRQKFKSAEVDAAKARFDIGIRDNVEKEALGSLEADVNKRTQDLAQQAAITQRINQTRVALQKIVTGIQAPEAEALKARDLADADHKRIRDQLTERRETFFVGLLPGKNFLNLPILDAFNSPRKIENLWSDGNLQNYSHRWVRRFDRCTTCHQLLQKTLPGTSTDPAYEPKRDVLLTLPVPTAEEIEGSALEPTKGSVDPIREVERLYGVRLSDAGLAGEDSVTVVFVWPKSAGARAETSVAAEARKPLPAREIRQTLASFTGASDFQSDVTPGLLPSDVISRVGESHYRTAKELAFRWLDAHKKQEPLSLVVTRGIDNPHTSHPRLDLFVGDLSPHRMATFGCTACHEGQGSGTDFKWASHSPNNDESDPEQSKRWKERYGWFNNHHWIYPMFPKRFAESACLKCHHNVVELEPSERFLEAPAPKVTQGYHLIRKYGCFGCHEINGYDGPTRRVGPDMRLEPNYASAAHQLAYTLSNGEQEARKTALAYAETLAAHPDNDRARTQLRLLVEEDASRPTGERVFTAAESKLADLLKDAETPGALRKVGPTLRFTKAKLDSQFVYDWTANPTKFRPSTKMPRFFGLWNHLKDEPKGLEVAVHYEPLEIAGIAKYLELNSQPTPEVEKPAGIAKSTREEKIARGKTLFETRGCLACHEHKDFPGMDAFRPKDAIVQGPNLSGLGPKFDLARNPHGREWLYGWLKDPAKYSSRTLMPNLYLEPIADADGALTDPIEDLIEYLTSDTSSGWKPDPAAKQKVDETHLENLVTEHLRESFKHLAVDYGKYGIPERRRSEVKVAEQELLVSDEEFSRQTPVSTERKLKYVGRKAIAKYGCFGCHDVPGFEDAKPIGTGLADWGRKESSKLAFEHIAHYLEDHGHGEHDHAKAGKAESHDHSEYVDRIDHSLESGAAGVPGFYKMAIEASERIGFIWQKLREPRSYDYRKTENKNYNDRLRMPKFAFDEGDREAVITFVLGLIAEPPTEKYVYKPTARQLAIQKGTEVLEKYNCGGCHLLEGDRWRISLDPSKIEEQTAPTTFPFMFHKPAQSEITAASKADRRGKVTSLVEGLLATKNEDALPQVVDSEGDSLEDSESYDPNSVANVFEIFRTTILGDKVYQTGVQPLTLPTKSIEKKYASHGGILTKYLGPKVLELEKQANPAAKGTEVYGWLPPPLLGEGNKVQTAWLHDFLLEPYAIRPAVFLRMPKFNMSSKEAEEIAAYFAAKDNTNYPHEFQSRRRGDHLASADERYQEVAGEDRTRLNDAMKIVVNGNYCVKCHLVGDFVPKGSPRALAPNLAKVFERLRPDYVKRWIANPKMILPYTAMPVNVPYDPEAAQLGGVSQDLFVGTSEDQVDGLVDLLMNFDEYARRRAKIAPLVQEPKTADATGNDVRVGDGG